MAENTKVDGSLSESQPLTPRGRIIQRLVQCGVPGEKLDPPHLVSFVKRKMVSINSLIPVILSTDAELEGSRRETFQEMLVWLQWLMFEGDPSVALKELPREHGVCRYVWGKGDTEIAYRCLTCALHPTSAICAPCFRSGYHRNHDFNSVYVDGGCCDCGDATAWNSEGFCSKHKGPEKVESLSKEVAKSISPVLESLFNFWEGKLIVVSNSFPKTKEIANDFTCAIVDMVLELCKHSQVLLSFIADLLPSSLLTVLLRVERFSIDDAVLKKLHEMFLQLLGVPTFKYEFAKAFVIYYPTVIQEAIEVRHDLPQKTYPLISTFSVEVFTVSNLSLRLVKERNLLTMLLGWLESIFFSCAEHGRLQVSRLACLYGTTRRVIEDIQFVMSHVAVSKYVSNSHQTVSRTWLKLLSYVQGMNPQKREIDQHVEEENKNVHLPFGLGHYIANIHSLFVDGAFSDACKEEPDDEIFWSSNGTESDDGKMFWSSDDEDDLGHAKPDQPSQESSSRNVSSSRTVFAPPMVFAMLQECLRSVEGWLRLENGDRAHFLSSPDWPTIIYDGSSQAISVHIPIHRFLSRLLQQALNRYCCESEMLDMTAICDANSSSTIYSGFFEHALRGSHPYGFSAFIMENPLRNRVFCAEVRAGMWLRNGSEAVKSCEWYRSVRWPEQGLELDLFLLQCCATLAPEDPFVRRILERFGLSNYLSLNLKRSCEHEHVLVQEMLSLIIQIINQRRFCGLTTDESLKRELIHVLSIEDATHSQLLKSLPCDLSKFDKLQDILDIVATYSNPSGFTQGTYSLRAPFWKELDLYHPRWKLKDLQVAEERYLRFCSISAQTTQLPKWTPIYPPLKGIARVATCKAVLEIIRAVLFYAVVSSKSAESRSPDSVLLPALHLLSLSLDICFKQKENSDNTFDNMAQIPIIAFSKDIIDQSSVDGVGQHSLLSLLDSLMQMSRKEENYDSNVETGGLYALVESLLKKFAELNNSCMVELQKLTPKAVSHSPQCVPTGDPSVSLLASDSEKRKAKARERQAAIMEKMKAQQTEFTASVEFNDDDDSQLGHEVDESKQVPCCLCHNNHTSEQPVSFLILLQKSRLVSSVDRGPPSKHHRSDKEHMPVLNTQEIDKNQNSGSSESISSSDSTQLVQNAAGELGSRGQPGDTNNLVQHIKNHFLALGNFQRPDTSCDEKEKISNTFETLEQDMHKSIRDKMHLGTFLDKIRRLSSSNEGKKVPTAEGNSNSRITGSAVTGKYAADVVREMSEHASGHASNVIAYVDSTSQHLANDGFGPTDCDGVHLSSCGHAVHQECLHNYLEELNRRRSEEERNVHQKRGEFACPKCRRVVNCVLPTLAEELHIPPVFGTSSSTSFSDESNVSLRLEQALNLLKFAANAVGEDEFLKAIPLHHIDDGTETNVDKISLLLSKIYRPEKQDNLSTFSKLNHSLLMWDTFMYSLTSMEIVARCGKTSFTPNFDHSVMVEELQSSSGLMLQMLLKLVQKTRSKNSVHVLQRFRGVQLFAESVCFGFSSSHADNVISGTGDMLSMFGMDKNTDIWKQASAPVLAHDPFTTLMWVLFCLPHPFLLCEDSLLSLVHAFYMVAVTQAIILYYEKSQGKSSSESAISDCMITDINKIMGESGCASSYFVSNYFNPSVIKDAIRRFSFPYLRRCALLWMILYPMSNRTLNLPGDTTGSVGINMFEFTKIQELEYMFKIPPLDLVLKDELSRSLVSVWCRRFCKEFESRRVQRIIHVTPAVPFKLMKLPKVYQDLLERCVKLRCHKCKSRLDDPALCLLCGTLCHQNWTSGCSENTCEIHSVACGAGIGVFLCPKRVIILLQRSDRMAPWPSPYLNAFGEEDSDMNRGKLLFLNVERYAALSYTVASHGLHLISEVIGIPLQEIIP